MRERLTYANVMATIAVFIALGGASYAALKVPKNSVGAKQIKKGAVTLNKIASSAQTALKGQKGDKGDPGLLGEPATRLFAEINGTFGTVSAGSGVTGSKKTGVGIYAVSFNRSLAGCAVLATAGLGTAAGEGDVYQVGSGAVVSVKPADPSTVTVETTANGGGPATNRSFFVAAFC